MMIDDNDDDDDSDEKISKALFFHGTLPGTANCLSYIVNAMASKLILLEHSSLCSRRVN